MHQILMFLGSMLTSPPTFICNRLPFKCGLYFRLENTSLGAIGLLLPAQRTEKQRLVSVIAV
jgi:hypothetical protein